MTKALKWWLAISLVVVFCAGAALGLFGCALHARHLFVHRHGPHVADRIRMHLQQELKLTPEQSEKISPMVERLATQLEAIRKETGERVAAAMSESHREITPLLTAEQRERLDKMRERHHRIMMHMRDFGPPPDEAP
jgi:hypothetical protein